HGVEHEEVIVAEQDPVVQERLIEARALRNHVERHEHAGRGHQPERLHHVGAHVAVLRNDFVVEETPEEMARQQGEEVHRDFSVDGSASTRSTTGSCRQTWWGRRFACPPPWAGESPAPPAPRKISTRHAEVYGEA